MAHEYKDNITCPWCDYEYDDYDSWDIIRDECEEEIDCGSCGKPFEIVANRSITYDTTKKDCKECDLGEWFLYHEIRQDTCDRWNRENFCSRSDHVPYESWHKTCSVCDNYEQEQREPSDETA